MQRITVIETPIGNLKIVESHGHVVEIRECDDKATPCESLPDCALQIKEYFNGTRKSFSFKILPKGTPFQKSVWRACLSIPYGTTITYGELAKKTGNPKSCRAVGAALNRNPLLLVVACHRVVGKNYLGGFRLGFEAKKFLLDLEKSQS